MTPNNDKGITTIHYTTSIFYLNYIKIAIIIAIIFLVYKKFIKK